MDRKQLGTLVVVAGVVLFLLGVLAGQNGHDVLGMLAGWAGIATVAGWFIGLRRVTRAEAASRLHRG